MHFFTQVFASTPLLIALKVKNDIILISTNDTFKACQPTPGIKSSHKDIVWPLKNDSRPEGREK